MNKQIKELAVKSGFELEDGGHLMLHHLYVTNRLEKFAELIVRECVEVGAQAFLKDNRIVPVFPANQIKQHFGVE